MDGKIKRAIADNVTHGIVHIGTQRNQDMNHLDMTSCTGNEQWRP
jgi:hypothetical protein